MTPGLIRLYKQVGIEAISVYYSCIPFNGFSNFVPLLPTAKRYNTSAEWHIPILIKAFPYVLALIVLAGFLGKTKPPKADGVIFEKGEG